VPRSKSSNLSLDYHHGGRENPCPPRFRVLNTVFDKVSGMWFFVPDLNWQKILKKTENLPKKIIFLPGGVVFCRR
jgi:hypothetical protein